MPEPLVEYECRDRIATITLNRPDKLNAVNDDMVRQIAAALSTFDTDNDAHVAILCGRGRAFSSGADVRQRQMRTREEFERHGGAQAQDGETQAGHGAAGVQAPPLPGSVIFGTPVTSEFGV